MAAGTSAVAVLGAMTGVVSLGWQIFKYLKEGPVLRLSVTESSYAVWQHADRAGPVYVMSVASKGALATTLTGVFLVHYRQPAWVSRLHRRRPFDISAFPRPQELQLPYKLNTGDQWTGLIPKSYFDLPGYPTRYVYLAIYHTYRRRPALVRVRLDQWLSTTL